MSDSSTNGVYVLRLFVAGKNNRSTRAIRNIEQICSDQLDGRCEFEIVDILENPQAAEDNRIIAVPTLLKEGPPPTVRLIGDMTETERVLESLNIPRS